MSLNPEQDHADIRLAQLIKQPEIAAQIPSPESPVFAGTNDIMYSEGISFICPGCGANNYVLCDTLAYHDCRCGREFILSITVKIIPVPNSPGTNDGKGRTT